MIMVRTRWIFAVALLLIVASITGPALADESGHFTVTSDGLPITGDLTNAVISNNTITMTMVIDQDFPTRLGPVHIVGDGVWAGISNNSTLTGTIENVTGNAKACFLIFCQQADFSGNGTWTGTLNDVSSGSGTFQGTLTFTGSPLAPSGPVAISGTWETTFQE